MPLNKLPPTLCLLLPLAVSQIVLAADPFDGKTLAGWTTTDGKPITEGWEIVDGAIHRKPGVRAGNIFTAHDYTDFDLSFEFKIAPRGNSGIKYRVRSYGGRILGMEYQIYDDAAAKIKPSSNTSTASIYDLYEPKATKKLKPAGEYNLARIVVQGNKIEHWLNGEKVAEAVVGDKEWERRVKASKFNDAPEFSRNPRGRIMLTDHGSEVWYRNFKFTGEPLPPEPFAPAVAKAPSKKPALKTETLVYKRVGKHEIKAEVTRQESTSPRPVVVWIHGGGLINGHRESVPAWIIEQLVPRGFAIVSIDYRLAPETKLPEIVADVEDAIGWIAKEGPKLFQADPKRIAVIGGSAGGYLTLVSGFRAEPKPAALVSLWGYGDLGAAWTSESSEYPRHNQTKITSADAEKIAAGPVVSDSRERRGDGGAYYQFMRRTGGWAKAVSGFEAGDEKFTPYMPERNVTKDYPPTLLIHGDADTDVPFESSARMAEQLKKHGVEHRLARFERAEHGLAGADPKIVADSVRIAADFLTSKLEGRAVKEPTKRGK